MRKKIEVTFGAVELMPNGDRAFRVYLDGRHVDTAKRAFDADPEFAQFYVLGDGHPALSDADLGGTAREAQKTIREMAAHYARTGRPLL